MACVSVTQNFPFRQAKRAAVLFSVASQKRKMKGTNEMTEPCSAGALNAHQKIWQRCPTLSPPWPGRPGPYLLVAEVPPLSPAVARLDRRPLRLRWALTIEPAGWSGTAHGEDALCKHG